MPEPIRVLHVEDDSEFADLTATFLQRENGRFTVLAVTDPSEAREALAEHDVDCILSDYEMPGEDGIEFLRGVRETYPDLPFVLFTGRGSEEVASEAISAGATDYLQKDAGSGQYALLANRIENAVAQYRAQQRSQRENSRRRRMLDRITDGYVSFDEELRFTYVNEPAAEFIQLPKGEIIGERYQDVRAEDGTDRFLSAFETALATQETRTVEARSGLQPDRWVEVRIYPSENGLSVYFRDVTERKADQRKLERSRRRLQAQFADAPDGIVIHDADGTVLEVNETMAAMLGYDVAALESMTVFDFDEVHDAEQLRETWGALSADERIKAESVHRRADGSTVPVEVWVSRIDVDDETRYLAHVRDISERKRHETQLQRERERFSALFAEFPEPTIAYEYVDGKSVIRDVNAAFEETFGYDGETAIGTRVDELAVPVDRLTEARQLDQRASSGERIDCEVVRQTATGDRFFYLRTIPVSLDGIDGYAVYADIHERKEREQDLERKNERLNQFVSIVSHDLRNPLNVASSRLTLARDDCDSEHLAYVERAHDRIGRIIDDTLTLARQGETVDDLGIVDLSSVPKRWWTGVETGEADLDVAADRSIRADPERLRHVFENLYRNAIEHGGDAVTVTVDTFEDGDDGGFFVADDGVGIPPAERDVIFDPGVSEASDGTGFGLTIVADVVEAHGWRIRATESDAGGARFEVTGVEFVE